VISGPESYSNQVITITNNTFADGNVTVLPGGDLSFENVTLILPFHSIFDIQGRAELHNSTVHGETWKLWIRGEAVLTRDAFVNATFGGTVVESSTSTFDRVVWDCGGNTAGTLHIRRAIDFKNNTLLNGCTAAYELASLTANKAIEIAFNTIREAGSGTALTFADAFHTGQVQFDIHDLFIANMSGWGILIGQTAPNTTFLIHDNQFMYTGSAAIRCDSFDGQLRIWNSSFEGVLRAARVNGVAGGTVVATLDNIYVNGTTDSIYAEDATWVIRNATILGPSPQFDAGPNGHIRIYDSADTAFGANSPSSGGSIEHFIRLEMAAPTWQNAVPITDDLVTLVDANGGTTLQVNASTWIPQEIVWWGMYPGNSRVDNRQLRPTIRDGATAFNCTPASFLVTQGMPLTTVTCVDDALPTITVLAPTFPRIQNASVISGTARVDEAGSGLNTVEFSLDGSAFGPVAFAPGDARNFSFVRATVADGMYQVTLRAVDRTGNVRLVTAGPLTVDTAVPSLAFDAPPAFISGSSYTITGVTEPNTTVSVARAGGFSNTTKSLVSGAFGIGVLLEEGLNTYTLTARDAAGNAFSLFASLRVDTRPPALVVLLDGRPVLTALEVTASVHVQGSSEATAEVRVNGLLAGRSGQDFALDVPLARGLTNLTVVATDLAGNSASWFGAAYFDDLPPDLAVEVNGESPTGGSPVVTRSASASFAGTAHDDDSGVAGLVVNGRLLALDGAGGFSTVVTLTEGANTIVVTASDAVGNTASITVLVVRDSTPPLLAVSVEADASPVVFTAGENHTAGSTVKLVLVVSEAGTVTFGGSSHTVAEGANAFVVTLAEGRNPFTVALVDLAGNPAVPLSLVIERKSIAPAVTLTAPAAGASVDAAAVEIVGVTDPLALVHVNGQAVSVSPTGEFRATVPLSLGENTVTIEVVDALGNANSTTKTVIRTAPPPAGNTAAAGGGPESFVMLAVGLGAGAALGLALGRRGRARPNDDEWPAVAAAGPAPRPEVAAPKVPAAGPARKGPRGPQPPGQ